jgi:hypothetical protein
MNKQSSFDPRPSFNPFIFYYLDVDLKIRKFFIFSEILLKEKKGFIEALKKAENYFETLEEAVYFQTDLATLQAKKMSKL